jgi:general stress protein 26
MILYECTRLDISNFAYETATFSRIVGHLSLNDEAPHPDKKWNLKKSEMWGFHEGEDLDFCLLFYETVQIDLYNLSW